VWGMAKRVWLITLAQALSFFLSLFFFQFVFFSHIFWFFASWYLFSLLFSYCLVTNSNVFHRLKHVSRDGIRMSCSRSNVKEGIYLDLPRIVPIIHRLIECFVCFVSISLPFRSIGRRIFLSHVLHVLLWSHNCQGTWLPGEMCSSRFGFEWVNNPWTGC
jgi:hypothetical protein